MLKLLVIEDQEEKFLAVQKTIIDRFNKTDLEIERAKDVITAKKKLSNTKYHLCVLDINLPMRSGEPLIKDAGRNLLDELYEMDHMYQTPKMVVGLTEYDDIYKASSQLFTDYFCSLILYENSSNAWASQLEKIIKKLILVEKTSTPPLKSVICIVNALDAPELDALLNLEWDWEKYHHENDPTTYYKCIVKAASGEDYFIYTAACEHMGMPSSTALAMKMIYNFSPRYIGMTGISAGTKGEVGLGDVIVADPSWDWGSGKYVIENKVSVFKPAPYQFCLSANLRNKFRDMQRSDELNKNIVSTWNGHVPAGKFKLHIGPIASGASVLADEDTAEKIKEQHRKMLGIEMEAFGIFSAANNAPIPQPEAFSIKSVCDYADSSKADDYHSYAAHTSAMTLKELVEKYL